MCFLESLPFAKSILVIDVVAWNLHISRESSLNFGTTGSKISFVFKFLLNSAVSGKIRTGLFKIFSAIEKKK